ncbi:MAG: family 78 glycoside hydrolase catalytic domain [Kiritimatiellia bacterium]
MKRTTTAIAAACVAWAAFAAHVDMEGARWIGEAGEKETTWRKDEAMKARGITDMKGHKFILSNPLPKNCLRLRKTFDLPAGKIAKAELKVHGLGFYELWMNGAKVDPLRVLSPANGGPRRTIADFYDVAPFAKPGEANTIGLWLSPGYSDDFSRFGWVWLAPKRAIALLKVTFEDGSVSKIATDGSWQSTTDGPIVSASIYHGETYDARREDPAWALPAGSKSQWRPATVFPDGPVLDDQPTVPIRLSDPRKPVGIVRHDDGKWTVDFGQNRAGVIRIRAKGPAGTRIRMHTSEILGANGRIDPWTNRGIGSADEFTLAGTGKMEEYTPRFTYHGFQYAEISGYPGELTADCLESVAIHADLRPTSRFSCSNPLLMKLHNAANWSMLSNLASYPTDCCMRDERTACQMDSITYEDAACQFFDMRTYYEKWLTDFSKDARNNPDSAQQTILPSRLLRYYGDRKYLEWSYDYAKVYVDAMLETHPDYIFTKGYGDWCAPNNNTWKGFFNDVEVVNTALFCMIMRQLADSAEELGKPDAAKYRGKCEEAKAAFHKRFFNPATNTYGDGSQANEVLPLAFDIVPAEKRDAVAKALVERIRTVDKGHIDTGIFGTRWIGDVLCDIGEADLLVEMHSKKDYPGFGYMFEQGATTLWEQWAFKGIMHSHNHAMMSGAASWLYTHLAGLRPAKHGYGEILVKPCFPKVVDHVNLERDTPQGTIAAGWRRTASGIEVTVKTPANVSGTLSLPGQPDRRLSPGETTVARFRDR